MYEHSIVVEVRQRFVVTSTGRSLDEAMDKVRQEIEEDGADLVQKGSGWSPVFVEEDAFLDAEATESTA